MSDHIETPVEDINNVRQLIALIKQRPCVNPNGTSKNRACMIGYAELAMMEKRLSSALRKLESKPSDVEKCEHGVDRNTVCRLCDPTVHIEPRDGWVHPLGAPKKESLSDLERAVIKRIRESRVKNASQLASEFNVPPFSMLRTLFVLQGLGWVKSDHEGADGADRPRGSKPEDVYTDWRIIP